GKKNESRLRFFMASLWLAQMRRALPVQAGPAASRYDKSNYPAQGMEEQTGKGGKSCGKAPPRRVA
ncbi:MAG: hypothetical protein KDI03_23380, partial [Anaerolineae bacterium]|nr:hypothetical protein [Anaerolineae bacterium]